MSGGEHAEPAYLRIADWLRGRIDAGEFSAGERLPPERDLVASFGVARMTVRQALDLLQAEGIIVRHRGRYGGTFVSSPPPAIELSRIDGILPQLREQHTEVKSEVLIAAELAASPTVASALEIECGASVTNISRIRSIDGVPALLENTFFPSAAVPGMLDADLTGSLYGILEGLGRKPVWKEESLLPARASRFEKEALAVSRNLPLLRIIRVTRDDSASVIEYSEDLLRLDYARIRVVTDARNK